MTLLPSLRTKVLIASRRCGAVAMTRQVAQAFQRHAQRARDRRGGQRQHVDLGAQRLHRLLVAHAEAVLLVDDQQAQALELHRLDEQLVRADDDVDRAVLDALQRRVTSLAERKRDSSATFTGHLPKRSTSVW